MWQSSATPLVWISMFGCIPFVLAMFAFLPPRRAVLVSFLFAWLFLPVAKFDLQGLPDYTKMSATCVGVLLAIIIFDMEHILTLSFAPKWVDFPMLVWCLCPLATVISNQPDLTYHDGFAYVFDRLVSWGLPYLIGRLYLSNRGGLREFTIAVFIGGLLYLPLCAYEIRMSPQLHRMVYGFHQHSVAQQEREGFFRPMVFMQHGLAVALYMTAASLAGVSLWMSGTVKHILRIPILWLVIPLMGVTLFCHSTAAVAFLGVGILLTMLILKFRMQVLLLAAIVIGPTYVASRTVFDWDGENLVSIIDSAGSRRDALSLQFRMRNETQIAQRAMERPEFGWGGYGRYLISSKLNPGEMNLTPDSLWVIALGESGVVGEVALLALLLPVAFLLVKYSHLRWTEAGMVGVAATTVMLILYSYDNLLNNMPNPLFILGLGGLCGLAASRELVGDAVEPGEQSLLEPASVLATA